MQVIYFFCCEELDSNPVKARSPQQIGRSINRLNRGWVPMILLRSPSDRQLGMGLAVLRVAVAAVFINHGRQKLFVYGFAGVTGAFTQMGVPFPGIMGPLIGLLEFFGGIALLFGFLTRLVAIGFVCDMLGAILLVQLKRGFSAYELEFLLLGSSLALALTGAGIFSVDAILAASMKRNAFFAARQEKKTAL
jgi:putative oxidoreductase